MHLEAFAEGVEKLRPALLGILLHVHARVGLLRKLRVLLPQLHQEHHRHHRLRAALQILQMQDCLSQASVKALLE